jgi:two-component system CheB/CheR fusion protein
LGLGLAISRALVELQGGRISAESRGKGRGATFRVVLPRATPPESVTAQLPRASGERSSACRVLLVEDHEDTADALCELLSLQGHSVRLARSVAEAVRIATSEDFDILVSDWGLPDGSGADAVDQIRRAGKDVRAIALSGYGMESDRQRSVRAGFSEHLVKPVSVRDLQAAIQRVANRSTAST